MLASRPIVVVGGGPAGIAAAIEAARAEVACLLIDEAPRLGGQIYRQPPREFAVRDPRALGRDFTRGQRLREAFGDVADRIEVLSATSVLGVWAGKELLYASEGAADRITPERLIVATGAYDRPVPFPGWTLPGVMTAGGAEILVKTMQVHPGQRALVAGTGPLLLVVANQLHKVGVTVVAVLEAGRVAWSPRVIPKVWGEWGLPKDAWDYWRGLRRAGIPLLFNHTIFEAHGQDEVTGASFGPVDPQDWRPLKAKAQATNVDLVVVGFGFVPNTELTALAGCRHRYVHEVGGWIPERDAFMETTVPGVFAAGDGAGVAGAFVAVDEGRVAGITAAEQLGALTAAEAARRRATPLRRLRSLARVRQILDGMSRIRPGLCELATPTTLVCRCEEVALSHVQAAIQSGARDLPAVRLLTRLGMGPCQGRQCAPSVRMLLGQATGASAEAVGRIHPRPPVKPVTLGALAQRAEREASIARPVGGAL